MKPEPVSLALPRREREVTTLSSIAAAGSNPATEDRLYMLDDLQIASGVNRDAAVAASSFSNHAWVTRCRPGATALSEGGQAPVPLVCNRRHTHPSSNRTLDCNSHGSNNLTRKQERPALRLL
jgi:hypothetical protein